jgi:hypothetical protein
MKRGSVARLGSRWIAFSVLLFLASSVSAHHATATEYDVSKTVTLKGTNKHFAMPDHFACATGITFSNGDHFTFVVGI